jgi:pimeloyl-ACP methyl ester carboxylesterase
VAAAVLAVMVTGSSYAYNLGTQGALDPPSGLRYVQTGDMRTRYTQWGAFGTPVVLLHGAYESADTWQPTAALLARRHRVYAIDLDGSGYTQRVAPYNTTHLASQVLEFIAAMRLDRPILVGHSSGAAVAAAAAPRAPERIAGVMFLDGDGLPLSGSADGGRSTAGPGIPLPQPYRTTLLRLVLRSDTVIRLVYAETCGPTCPPLTEAGVVQFRRPYQVAGAEPALQAVLRTGIPSLPTADLAGLARLPLPKAVVFGAADPEYAPGAAAGTAALIGAPTPTLIPGARHLTLVSSPAAVADSIERLAARVGTAH